MEWIGRNGRSWEQPGQDLSMAAIIYQWYNQRKLNKQLLDAARSGDLKTVKNCLYYGADIEAQDNDGLTSLMRASANGHIEIAQLLIDNGANINAKDNDGWTSLMRACFYGNIETAQFLIDNGANINAKKDNKCLTSLMWACDNGYIENCTTPYS